MKLFSIYKSVLVIIFTILAFSQKAEAQNWQLLSVERTYNYTNNEEGYITHQLWVDSLETVINGDVLYLNRIAGVCDTCEGLVEGYIGKYYTNNHPQFLMKKAVQNESYFWMQDSANMVIYPHADLAESWLFDSLNILTAEVTALSEESIFGQMDSVKTITVDAREIRISKSFGILEFPDYATETMSYQLIGIEGESESFGYQRPELLNFFDLEIGEGKMAFYSESWPEHSLWFYDKLVLTNKTIENDTLTLDFERIKYACNASFENVCDPYDFSNLQVFEENLTQKIPLNEPHEATAPLNQLYKIRMYNYGLHGLNEDLIEFNSSGYTYVETNIHNDLGLTFGLGAFNYDDMPFPDSELKYNTKLYDSTANIFYDIESSDGFYYGSHFKEAFGLVKHLHQAFENQINYVISDWTDGNGNWLSVEDLLSKNIDEFLYPNPATSHLYIDNLKAGQSYEIYDSFGRKVMSGNYQGKINLSGLTSGMYFIRYVAESNVKTKAFMIQ
ncbi:MAG: T9SS type A sorting domain-containing protein [Bacteroidales bacterium]|jgi:hypothetical protein|nr:T9SS type A sorting domain-containing protein [Bacteroidales bacterium]